MQHCIVYNSIISFPFTTYNWSSTEKWSPQWLFKEGLGESGCCIFLRPPLETSAKTPRHWEVLKDPGILRYLQEARFWILELSWISMDFLWMVHDVPFFLDQSWGAGSKKIKRVVSSGWANCEASSQHQDPSIQVEYLQVLRWRALWTEARTVVSKISEFLIWHYETAKKGRFLFPNILWMVAKSCTSWGIVYPVVIPLYPIIYSVS